MADRAGYDQNLRPSLIALSNADGVSPVALWADPATHTLSMSTAGRLITAAYDSIVYTNTSTTVDTYVYKSGGSGGTTVATVTITYTDSTKGQISTVVRT